MYPLDAGKLVACTVPLTYQIGELNILGPHVGLHALELFSRFLSRVGPDLELLVLAEHLNVFLAQLAVHLGKRFVFLFPHLDLVCQRKSAS